MMHIHAVPYSYDAVVLVPCSYDAVVLVPCSYDAVVLVPCSYDAVVLVPMMQYHRTVMQCAMQLYMTHRSFITLIRVYIYLWLRWQ